MHLLPERTKKEKSKIVLKDGITFFYVSLSTISLLLFSAFLIKFHLNNKNVLGAKSQTVVNKLETSKEILFWQDLLIKNPKYYEGWIELYNLTGRTEYLIKAKGIDPNR